MKAWAGSAILAVLDIGLALWSLAGPWWLTVIVIVVGVVGVLLMWPVRVESQPVQNSAFVAGDASKSRFVDVSSTADRFVDGDAREALFLRIVHKPRSR